LLRQIVKYFLNGLCIIANAKARREGLTNGTVGTVRGVEEIKGRQKMTVAVDVEKGKPEKLVSFMLGDNKKAGEFDSFRYDAGTIYKSQGRTLDQMYLYHSQHWRSASAYVALTRHRESVAVFAARDTAKDLPTLAKQFGRDENARAVSAYKIHEKSAARGGFGAAAFETTGLNPAVAANTPRPAAQATPVKQNAKTISRAAGKEPVERVATGPRKRVTAAAAKAMEALSKVAAIEGIASSIESLFGADNTRDPETGEHIKPRERPGPRQPSAHEVSADTARHEADERTRKMDATAQRLARTNIANEQEAEMVEREQALERSLRR
jgi:hypothetical protein